MSWALVIALAAVVFGVVLWRVGRPRSGWEALAAALLVGLAGYAFQGSPSVPAAPRSPAEEAAIDPSELVGERQKLAGDDGQGDKALITSDALARHGDFADAATVLNGAVERDPKNAQDWLALGNALVGHAQGMLSPAALYAYDRAEQADPKAPGPAYFRGLVLAGGGDLAAGRAQWAKLVASAPADAPWRKEMVEKLARLDQLIAFQAQERAQVQATLPPQP